MWLGGRMFELNWLKYTKLEREHKKNWSIDFVLCDLRKVLKNVWIALRGIRFPSMCCFLWTIFWLPPQAWGLESFTCYWNWHEVKAQSTLCLKFPSLGRTLPRNQCSLQTLWHCGSLKLLSKSSSKIQDGRGSAFFPAEGPLEALLGSDNFGKE